MLGLGTVGRESRVRDEAHAREHHHLDDDLGQDRRLVAGQCTACRRDERHGDHDAGEVGRQRA
jgi:hypothetical protein